MSNETDVRRLEEIKDEMAALLDEAKGIMRRASSLVYERANSYWYAHIVGALTRDHEFLGGSMVTMEDSIEELKKEEVGGQE